MKKIKAPPVLSNYLLSKNGQSFTPDILSIKSKVSIFKFHWGYSLVLLLLFSCVEDSGIPEPSGKIITTTLFSEHVKVQYDLHISLPPNYDQENKHYKVIYILDGEELTSPVLASLEELKNRNQVKEDYILVGIDDGTETGRFRDYTPGSDLSFTDPTGDADKFYVFLTEELLPFIGQNYRVKDRENILYGHSLGGLFVVYTFLQHKPEEPFFDRYVALSPSIWYNDGILYDYEREFYEKHKNKSIPAKLYMMTGGLEGVVATGHMKAMYDRLSARNYPDLQIKSQIIPSTTHFKSKNDIYYDIESLRWSLD